MSESKIEQAAIAVGVDGSKQSLAAVQWAAGEAARRQAGLLLVHAVGIPSLYMGPWEPPHELRAKLVARGEALLTAAREVAEQAADVAVTTRVDNDDPAVALVAASRSVQLVALGATGRGGFLTGLGSAAVQVSAHAHAPVVIVRGDAVHVAANAPIVVGVDSSPAADAALGQAFEEASLYGAPLKAVHTWFDNDAIKDLLDESTFANAVSVADLERQILTERIAQWQDKYPDVEVQPVVERNRARRVLAELSAEARLVVVGSRGRGGFRGLVLGSTSQALIHRAQCPVMVVRSSPQE